jgi:hypothetical protein
MTFRFLTASFARHQHGLPAFFLDEFLDLGGLLGLVEKGDQDVCAFACECDRDPAAYAAVTAVMTAFIPFSLPEPLSRRGPDAVAWRRLSPASVASGRGRATWDNRASSGSPRVSIPNDGLRARFRIGDAERDQTPRQTPPRPPGRRNRRVRFSPSAIEFSNPARDGSPPTSAGNFRPPSSDPDIDGS